jgi:hypothetical protein
MDQIIFRPLTLLTPDVQIFSARGGEVLARYPGFFRSLHKKTGRTSLFGRFLLRDD